MRYYVCRQRGATQAVLQGIRPDPGIRGCACDLLWLPTAAIMIGGAYALTLAGAIGRGWFNVVIFLAVLLSCVCCCNVSRNVSSEKLSAKGLQHLCEQVVAKEEGEEPQHRTTAAAGGSRRSREANRMKFVWRFHCSMRSAYLKGSIDVTVRVLELVRLLQLLKFADSKAATYLATSHGKIMITHLLWAQPSALGDV